jgi:hypothetical protein
MHRYFSWQRTGAAQAAACQLPTPPCAAGPRPAARASRALLPFFFPHRVHIPRAAGPPSATVSGFFSLSASRRSCPLPAHFHSADNPNGSCGSHPAARASCALQASMAPSSASFPPPTASPMPDQPAPFYTAGGEPAVHAYGSHLARRRPARHYARGECISRAADGSIPPLSPHHAHSQPPRALLAALPFPRPPIAHAASTAARASSAAQAPTCPPQVPAQQRAHPARCWPLCPTAARTSRTQMALAGATAPAQQHAHPARRGPPSSFRRCLLPARILRATGLIAKARATRASCALQSALPSICTLSSHSNIPPSPSPAACFTPQVASRRCPPLARILHVAGLPPAAPASCSRTHPWPT